MLQRLELKMGLALVLVLVLVTACGGGGAGGSVSDVTGSWGGGLYQTTNNFHLMSMDLDIVEANGVITGTGTLQGTARLTVEGHRSGRNATIRFHLGTERDFIVVRGSFSGSSFRGTYTQRGVTTPMTEVRLQRR